MSSQKFDMSEFSDKIQEYAYLVGVKKNLISKETKKEDLTFEEVHRILGSLMQEETNNILGSASINNIWSILGPLVKDTTFGLNKKEKK